MRHIQVLGQGTMDVRHAASAVVDYMRVVRVIEWPSAASLLLEICSLGSRPWVQAEDQDGRKVYIIGL